MASRNNKLLRAALDKFLKAPARNTGRRVDPTPTSATKNKLPAENTRNYLPESAHRMAGGKYKGGSYNDLMVKKPGATRKTVPEGGQINHIPPCQAMKQVEGDGWSDGKGGAIQMDTLDHRKARSTGSSDDSVDHRDHQERLIANGQLEDAIALDVLDIRARFGDKYDDAISEMVDNCYPEFQGLKTIQPTWKSQGL